MRHRTTPAVRRFEQHSVPFAHCAAPHSVAPRSTVPATAVNFKIDRLTVEGYSVADQKRFTYSLKSHLAALVQKHSDNQRFAANGLTITRLDAGQLPVDATPDDAARQIARRIFARLTQTRVTRQSTRQSEGEGHA